MSESVNLYLDKKTRDVMTKEAQRYNLTFSAFIRVMAIIFSEPASEILPMNLDEFRAHVHAIVDKMERRV